MSDKNPSNLAEAQKAAKLVDTLAASLRETANEVVPWFMGSMSPMYFQDSSEAEQQDHLRAIIAAKASGRPLDLVLKSADGTRWTFMAPHNRPGMLASMAKALPRDFHMRSAKIHASGDDSLLIVIFEAGDAPVFDPADPVQMAKLEETATFSSGGMAKISRAEVESHFKLRSAESVRTLTPLRIRRQMEAFAQVSQTESTTIALEDENEANHSRIVVTVANTRVRNILERIAERLSRARINIARAYLDKIADGPNRDVNILGFVVEGPEGKAIDPGSDLWESVKKDLLRLKWIDQFTLDLAYRHEGLSITRAEIVMALSHLVNHILVKENRYAFDRNNIVRHAERNFGVTSEIVDLFLLRFNPERPMADDEFEKRCTEIREHISAGVDPEARVILGKFVDVVKGVYRTNAWLRTRYALSMRIDPKLLEWKERPELPYGVFFVHGRSFNGFHVRFRDIARGGIRAVRTIGSDQHARECERLYDEVYGLAFAQQLKNKDIPEGGSKGVVLIEPETPVDRCVKAFVDSILDLITPDPEVTRKVIDRWGRPEFLYFGPDENITPELINWVVDRARRRGYPMPTALMSSKPGAGINHKTYGVTSEGVNVFLRAALEHVGIDPTKRPFTVKITGGPDGDVAGNMIRILDRDYGANARIVGIGDGSGVGEDPDGLDHAELLRLFREALPIGKFDRKKLGPKGRVVTVEEPEGVALRNTLHNRLATDAFVPGGGRPSTIHAQNWKDFLLPDGRPSSPVIVEGANLFLTTEARLALAERGCLIIKDSSANKCGVITSSFEIGACMLIDDDQFLSIKDQYVEQVLEKLRFLARREADLLLRMNRFQPDIPLYEFSIRLSRAIIKAADAIEAAVDTLEKEDGERLRQLVREHLPEVLLRKVGDRLWSDIPRAYLKWIMAKSLAARMVYREGFEIVEHMTESVIAKNALRFLRVESRRVALAAELMRSDLPGRERIVSVLETSGILQVQED